MFLLIYSDCKDFWFIFFNISFYVVVNCKFCFIGNCYVYFVIMEVFKVMYVEV